ncbi:MAG: membrane protein insertion efficiency factor YidD [Deltaproteobacteria bacterium]|nr:membrane protein insertion efficiency factor YidD [Deltaproteobacteria bacterium]
MGIRAACALVAALVLAPFGPVARAAWDPPGWWRPPGPPEEEPVSPAALPLAWAVDLYRVFVSPVDGDRCPSSPTCSAYAREAVRERGFLLGFALTAGRLVSEADQAAFGPRVRVGGQWKVYAPVSDDLAFLKGRLEP